MKADMFNEEGYFSKASMIAQNFSQVNQF